MLYPLRISSICPVRRTQCAPPTSIPAFSNRPYLIGDFFIVYKVPPFLSYTKIQNEGKVIPISDEENKIAYNTLCTRISCLMKSFTFDFMCFQLLTPMSGAYFLVNMTTSSTKERWLNPTGPPNLDENCICSF